MKRVEITVRPTDAGWVADVEAMPASDQFGPEEHPGSSPDEALGYAIRDMWLAGWLDDPICITLDFLTTAQGE